MKVSPPRRRSVLHGSDSGLEIIIPSKRNIWILMFFSAWLVIWGIGEFDATQQLLNGQARRNQLFLTAWLTIWTGGGCFVLFVCAWMIAGREILSLSPGQLSLRRAVFGLGLTKEYDLLHVRNLRVSPQPIDLRSFNGKLQMCGVSGGLIAFDYGSQTVRFALGVDEAEASQIVADLTSREEFKEATA